MGSSYSSYANIVYKIINTLGWLAGVACLMMVLVSLFKIITGDENDSNRYTKRIKNGIIALIIILSITQLVTLVTTYFNIDAVDYKLGIGDFTHVSSGANGDILADTKDVQGRDIYVVDDYMYVVTDKDKKISIGGGWFSGQKRIVVSYLRYFDDCQGLTKGAFADIQYVLFQYNENGDAWGDNIDSGYCWNYIFPYERVDGMSGVDDAEKWKLFFELFGIKNTALDGDGKEYTVWYKYDSNSNPFNVDDTNTVSLLQYNK